MSFKKTAFNTKIYLFGSFVVKKKRVILMYSGIVCSAGKKGYHVFIAHNTSLWFTFSQL